jgi:hypothetical protein
MTVPFDIAAYKADMVAKGFRVDEEHERGDDGWPTLAGKRSEQDQYIHNVAISLRHAIEAAGGRGTPGGDAVSGLFHTITAQALDTDLWLKHVAEVGLPVKDAPKAPGLAMFRTAPSTGRPRAARVSRIMEAINLPNCPDCSSGTGNPCRTPLGKTTAPHASRPRPTVAE